MTSGIIFSLALYLGLFTIRGRCLRMSGVWVPPVAVSGTEVKFTCHYETSPSVNDTLYSLKWYRGHDQFYEYIPKNKPPMKVYESAHVHVDKSQSDANTVVLKGITRETSGSFQCEVMGDKPLFETDNYTKNMTVVDIPTWGPRLTHRPLSSKVGVQDIIQARCEVGPSDPPTEITWLINRTPAPPYARVETYKNENRVHVSELHIQVTEDLFYKRELVVTCRAKLLSAFDETANVTFIDVNSPEPAGYGWLSAGKIVQSRWNPLQECFRRELQTHRDKSGDASTGRMYLYFERLLFLASTLQAPETNVNYSTAVYEDNEGDDEKDVSFGSPDEPTEPAVENDPPKSKKSDDEQLPGSLKNKAHGSVDKDVLFFLSLVPEFQTLEADLQLDVKIELLQVIKRAQQTNRERSSLENGKSVLLPDGPSSQQDKPYHQHTAGPHPVHDISPTSGPTQNPLPKGSRPTPTPLATQEPQPT